MRITKVVECMILKIVIKYIFDTKLETMKMKKQSLRMLPLIICATILFSCNINSSEVKQSDSTIVKTTNPEKELIKSNINEPQTCYVFDNGKDKIEMQITITNNVVNGQLNYNYFQKDKNSGTIEGKMFGDTLFANYNFMSEGKESKRDVVFLKRGENFVEGYGDINPSTGNPDLSERSAIKFGNDFILEKRDCKLE